MLKKSITYRDYNGQEVTEDFYFNLSKLELIELELRHEGGLAEGIQKIMDAKDGQTLFEEFKRIVFTAYGKRSEDGKRFIKNQALRDEWESTNAPSELVMSFLTDANAAAEFIQGIMPQGFVEEMAQMKLEGMPEVTEEQTPPKKLAPADILEMDGDELKSGLATGKYVI